MPICTNISGEEIVRGTQPRKLPTFKSSFNVYIVEKLNIAGTNLDSRGARLFDNMTTANTRDQNKK